MNYRIGLIFVIRMKNKFLVTHPKGALDIEWYFPGCGIEAGETEKEAFFREMYEELGLKKEDFILYKNTEIVYKYNWPEKLVKEKGFLGQQKKFILGEIKNRTNIDLTITNELDDAKWYFWDELFEVIPFESLKEILRNNEQIFRN
jgi:8-oxo-dGTP pyrophosphatase MutT (NUDIX family)